MVLYRINYNDIKTKIIYIKHIRVSLNSRPKSIILNIMKDQSYGTK